MRASFMRFLIKEVEEYVQFLHLGRLSSTFSAFELSVTWNIADGSVEFMESGGGSLNITLDTTIYSGILIMRARLTSH
jgi:hypothetical protein